jgi:hypothetical protein
LKVNEIQERVMEQVALKGPILRLGWMWRISKTLTKADGKIVRRKEVLEDKLISGCRRNEAPAVCVLWIKFRFSRPNACTSFPHSA